MSGPHLGVMHPTERCPKCNSRIMVGQTGNRWCVGQDCDYHVRNGKLVTATDVKRLGDRCPVRIP
jgi:hypothetical protein